MQRCCAGGSRAPGHSSFRSCAGIPAKAPAPRTLGDFLPDSLKETGWDVPKHYKKRQAREAGKSQRVKCLKPLTVIEPSEINGLGKPGEYEEVVLSVDSVASETVIEETTSPLMAA